MQSQITFLKNDEEIFRHLKCTSREVSADAVEGGKLISSREGREEVERRNGDIGEKYKLETCSRLPGPITFAAITNRDKT